MIFKSLPWVNYNISPEPVTHALFGTLRGLKSVASVSACAEDRLDYQKQPRIWPGIQKLNCLLFVWWKLTFPTSQFKIQTKHQGDLPPEPLYSHIIPYGLYPVCSGLDAQFLNKHFPVEFIIIYQKVLKLSPFKVRQNNTEFLKVKLKWLWCLLSAARV